MAKKNKTEKRIERDIVKVILFFLFLVIIFFAVSAYFKSLHTFTYNGLTFTEESVGPGSSATVFHYYYYYQTDKGKLIRYNLYLHKDPRENNVPIVANDSIIFSKKPLFLSLNTTRLNECEDGLLALGTLALFLRDNQLDVRPGQMGLEDSKIYNQTHVNCALNSTQNIIEVFRADNTEVISEGKCVQIKVGPDCGILDAVEKLQVQMILDAKAESDEIILRPN